MEVFASTLCGRDKRKWACSHCRWEQSLGLPSPIQVDLMPIDPGVAGTLPVRCMADEWNAGLGQNLGNKLIQSGLPSFPSTVFCTKHTETNEVTTRSHFLSSWQIRSVRKSYWWWNHWTAKSCPLNNEMDPSPFISLIANSVTSFLPVKPIHVFSDFRGIYSPIHATRLPSTPSAQGSVANQLLSVCQLHLGILSVSLQSPLLAYWWSHTW